VPSYNARVNGVFCYQATGRFRMDREPLDGLL